MFTKTKVNKAVCRASASSLGAEVCRTVRAFAASSAVGLFGLAVFAHIGPSFAGASEINANSAIVATVDHSTISQVNANSSAQGASGALTRASMATATDAPTMPASMASGIGLAAAANYRISQASQWKDVENVLVLSVLNGIAKAGANAGQHLTTAQYARVATQVRAFLDTKVPADPVFADEAASLRYAINALVPLVNAAPASPFLPGVIGGLESLKFTTLELPLDPSRQTPSDLATYSVAVNAFAFIADQVQEASDLAHNDAQIAAAVDPVLVDLVGLGSAASYAQISSAYPHAVPALPTPNRDGSFTVDPQNLQAQYQSLVDDVAATVDAHLASIESQAGLTSSPTSGTQFNALALQPNAPSAPAPCTAGTPSGPGSIVYSKSDCTSNPGKPDDYWKNSQGLVTGLSKLFGNSNPQLGKQIADVGGAVVSAGQAVAQIDGIVKAGAIFASLGSTVAFANPVTAIIGAGFTIFNSLFGDGSANQNAAVLNAIRKLSQQVSRLEQDMTNRFNHVDAALNVILETLASNFALIDYQLGVLNGDAHAVQVGLLDVQAQLNDIEQYSLAYSQAQSKASLIAAMNGCLNYRAVHSGADIGQSQYFSCENDFYTWAHNNASDQLWAGLLQPNYGDSNIYNTLFNFPLSVNVNYLAQLTAQSLGLPALSVVRIANPNEWVVGARSYLQLAHDWRSYASQMNSSRLDDLIQSGTNLQRAIRAANSTASTSGIVANKPLFSAVLNKYNTAITSLGSAMQSDVISYLGNPANGLTNANGITLSLFAGGANQKTSWRPPLGTIKFCDGSGTSLPGPAILAAVPDLYAFSQGFLQGSGQLSACISQVKWGNQTTVSTPATCHAQSTNILDAFPKGPTPLEPACVPLLVSAVGGTRAGPTYTWRFVPSSVQTFAPVTVSVDVRFNGTPILTVTGTSQQPTLQSEQKYALRPGASGSIYCQAEHTPNVAFCLYQTLGCGTKAGCIGLASGTQTIAGGFQPTVSNTSPQAAIAQNWTSNLMLQSLINSMPQVVSHPQPQLITAIAAQVDAVSAGHQRRIYANIAADFGAATPVQASGQLVTGAKLLTAAYVNFGLPTSLTASDTLRGLLYGSQRILDGPDVQRDFLAFSTASISDTTRNRVSDEIATLTARSTALASVLTDALARIQQSGAADSSADVDLMLEELRAFATLKNAGALSFCSYRLSSSRGNVGVRGGPALVAVNTSSGCDVAPSSGSTWLHASIVSSAPGQYQVSVIADPNESGIAREGVVIFGDQLYRVIQVQDILASQ